MNSVISNLVMAAVDSQISADYEPNDQKLPKFQILTSLTPVVNYTTLYDTNGVLFPFFDITLKPIAAQTTSSDLVKRRLRHIQMCESR